MQSQTFKKCLNVTFPKNVFILPFYGNLTESNKNELSSRIQKYFMDTINKKIEHSDLKKVIFHDLYGSVQHNLKIETHKDNENKINLIGEGFQSFNIPKEQIVIIN